VGQLNLATGAVQAFGAGSIGGGMDVDPADGDIFYGVDTSGSQWRIAYNSWNTTLVDEVWVARLPASGDPDPIGVHVLPAAYGGPGDPAWGGQALSVDRDNSSNNDSTWVYDVTAKETYSYVHEDANVQVDARDVWGDESGIYVADGGAPTVWTVTNTPQGGGLRGYDLAALNTTDLPTNLSGIAGDPASGKLYVTGMNHRVYSVDRATGAWEEVGTGFSDLDRWGNIEISDSGDRLWIIDQGTDTVYQYVHGSGGEIDMGGTDKSYSLDMEADLTTDVINNGWVRRSISADAGPEGSLHTEAGCSGDGYLRSGGSGDNSLELNFVNLPDHDTVSIGMIIAQIASLDPARDNDRFRIELDGTEILSAGLGYGEGVGYGTPQPEVYNPLINGLPVDVSVVESSRVMTHLDVYDGPGDDNRFHSHAYDLRLMPELQGIPHTGDTLTVEIVGYQNQGGGEWYGLDDVTVVLDDGNPAEPPEEPDYYQWVEHFRYDAEGGVPAELDLNGQWVQDTFSTQPGLNNDFADGGFSPDTYLRTTDDECVATLVLTNLPEHTHISLAMVVGTLESIDPQRDGDIFHVLVDGEELLRVGFGYGDDQGFSEPLVHDPLIWGAAADTALFDACRTLSYIHAGWDNYAYELGLLDAFQMISHSSDTLTIQIIGKAYQGWSNEAYAMDNIVVSLFEARYNEEAPVSEPAGLGLLSLAGLAMRKRRS
jgi:hypothetical protein